LVREDRALRNEEPAFPTTQNGHTGGLTKRELFAAMAMQGLAANSIPGAHHLPTELIAGAVELADALIEKLNKTKEKNNGNS
jgi:hypothetical protein